MDISAAQLEDLSSIVSIYNWAIVNTTATLDTQEKTVQDQLNWFDSHNSKYPIVVFKDKEIVKAWGSLSKWSDRCAYSSTAEVSLYVHPDFHGQGIGGQLLKELIKLGQENELHTIISRIVVDSEVSVHLHKKMGFVPIGVMKEVGRKFDKVLDVILMQRML